jgi:dTMP kinase
MLETLEPQGFILGSMPGKSDKIMLLIDNTLSHFIRKAQQEIEQVDLSNKKGLLIVFEGLDGSGKSTQVKLLADLFSKIGNKVIVSKWNSADRISSIIKELKSKKDLKPQTWGLLEAADLYERLRNYILPTLNEGGVAILDRYYYTALVRGAIRGLNYEWILNLYKYVPSPDFIFYFKIDPSISLSRVIRRSKDLTLSDVLDVNQALKYYESGQDLSLNENPLTNFYLFQKQMISLYEKIFETLKDKTYNVDASKDIFSVYEDILKHLREKKALHGIRQFRDIIYFVEFPKDSVRAVKENKLIMPCDYGFIPNTLGEDFMEIDVLVGEDQNSDIVIKFYHHNKKGNFSEVKYALGFSSAEEAVNCYSMIYPGRILEYDIITFEDFKKEIFENKIDPKIRFIEDVIKVNIKNENNNK